MSLREVLRPEYPHVCLVPTRWSDNDTYGHVNNVIYYSYFDTAVNQYLIANGALDIEADPVVGYVVDSGCSFFQPVSFPDLLHVGIRVARIGTSSVRYEVALFRNADERAAAAGHFVHVYVDRKTGRTAAIPDAARSLLLTIAAPLSFPPNSHAGAS